MIRSSCPDQQRTENVVMVPAVFFEVVVVETSDAKPIPSGAGVNLDLGLRWYQVCLPCARSMVALISVAPISKFV